MMYQWILLLLSFVIAVQSLYTPCAPCRGEDCELPDDVICKYGVVRDYCGREVCAAGPGERCGGRDSHLGKCGGGMTCKCGLCKGCSIERLMLGIIECDNTPMCT